MAAYGLCHPNWSRAVIRTAIRKDHGRKVFHFVHQIIDAKAVLKVFQVLIIPHCPKHGYKLVIVDNDSKFHTKALVQASAEEGIQIYPGSGKRCWVLHLSKI